VRLVGLIHARRDPIGINSGKADEYSGAWGAGRAGADRRRVIWATGFVGASFWHQPLERQSNLVTCFCCLLNAVKKEQKKAIPEDGFKSVITSDDLAATSPDDLFRCQ
jgi:hypothetical protein